MDFNWTENIVFINDEEWKEDFDWNWFAEIVFQKTGFYPVDKGDNSIVECKNGVNYHFRLVSKEDYDDWYFNQ